MIKTTNKQNGNAKPHSILEEVQTILADEVRWKGALAAAEKQLAQAEGQLSQARLKLADEESRYFAKHSAMLGDDAPAAQDFTAAQLMVTRCQALCGGLRRQISDADVQLLSAHEKLKFHREQYAQQTVAQFMTTVYEPAVAAWRSILRKAHALGAALEIPMDPAGPDHSLGNVLRPPTGSDQWQADREAKALYNQHNSLRELADQLEQHRVDSVNRVLQNERERKESAGFDPTGTYEVVKRFLVFGQPFEPGRKVSAHDLRLKLLEGLYQTKSIRMIPKHSEYER
jgi:hypothetical protein